MFASTINGGVSRAYVERTQNTITDVTGDRRQRQRAARKLYERRVYIKLRGQRKTGDYARRSRNSL